MTIKSVENRARRGVGRGAVTPLALPPEISQSMTLIVQTTIITHGHTLNSFSLTKSIYILGAQGAYFRTMKIALPDVVTSHDDVLLQTARP